LQKCFSGIHPRWTVPLAHAWSSDSREKGGVVGYLGEENEYLIQYSKDKLKEIQDIDYFIYGHRHILINLPIAEHSRVVILGDWITLFSYAVFDGNSIKLENWEM
jgi:UDP-2,3-diacylglucosamine hydrolase